MDRLKVYLLAGVATSINYFEGSLHVWEQQFAAAGWPVQLQTIYPYGDSSRKLWKQVREVYGDLSNRAGAGRAGGKYAFGRITSEFNGGPILLVGHSGGGAAAYQAARMLQAARIADSFRVVQIGSPKAPILPEHRAQVSYFHAVDDNGKAKDPISRLGSWGGWKLGRAGVPVWDRMKYAPGFVGTIPVVGGHADYFRDSESFVRPASQETNLRQTLSSVICWLQQPLT